MPHFRYDSARFAKTTITDDGFLKTDAILTRTGVFLYKNSDGSIRRELRHPDDVFKEASLNSMKMIPMTDSHPEQKKVNSDSAKDLQVGHVGENVRPDGAEVKGPLTITDGSSVQKVQRGKNQLSLGYTADIVDEKGEYNGKPYDSRQTNIRYNHLAIVDVARAGPSARIHLDSGEAAQVLDDDQFSDERDGNNETGTEKPTTRGESKMPKIIIDGISYEASQEVINALDKSKTRIDDLEKDIDAKKTLMGELEAEKDGVKAKLDAFEGRDLAKEINDAATTRARLISKASTVLDEKESEKLDSMTDLEIKKTVILKISPAAAEKLNDASDAYVEARYDAALDMQGSRKDFKDQRKTVNDQRTEGTNNDSVESAQARYLKRLSNGGKE